MNENRSNGIGTKFLVAAASVVVILAGLKSAQSLAAPFFLAVFFAMVLLPPLRLLKRKGFADWSALLTLSLLVFLFGIGLVWILSYSLTDFANRLPAYRIKATAGVTQVDNWINNVIQKFKSIEESVPKISVPEIPFAETSNPNPNPNPNPNSNLNHNPNPDQNISVTEIPVVPAEVSADVIQPVSKGAFEVSERFSLFDIVHVDTLIGFIHFGVSEILNIVTVSSLIVVMVIFMLIEAARMPDKIREAFSGRDLSNEYFRKIAADTWNYMKIKTIINLLTGFVTAVGLWLLGVEYALLWGVLMFFLNYIPNIGQIVASIPPILLALIDHGLASSVVVMLWLIVVNTAFGYGVEPRYLERGLGISGLVVLLSLIFWGWLLGPIGMFLSAPLTMVLKIVLQNDQKTHWIAVLLSNHASENLQNNQQ
ncbi:MAG: AI-2E family transporter [Planctomycetaceae bacterium]|jgi:predicted PurR-regulated permease PerM|nr:AI-2E family transporter [Planctomycetaceae bacterium]